MAVPPPLCESSRSFLMMLINVEFGIRPGGIQPGFVETHYVKRIVRHEDFEFIEMLRQTSDVQMSNFEARRVQYWVCPSWIRANVTRQQE